MKSEEKRDSYFDSIWYSSLQAKLSVLSFVSGVVIGSVCLFAVPPKGEISTSAISIVSELLVLAGALLGVMVNVDAKQQRFAAKIAEQLAHKQDKQETPEIENQQQTN